MYSSKAKRADKKYLWQDKLGQSRPIIPKELAAITNIASSVNEV